MIPEIIADVSGVASSVDSRFTEAIDVASILT